MPIIYWLKLLYICTEFKRMNHFNQRFFKTKYIFWKIIQWFLVLFLIIILIYLFLWVHFYIGPRLSSTEDWLIGGLWSASFVKDDSIIFCYSIKQQKCAGFQQIMLASSYSNSYHDFQTINDVLLSICMFDAFHVFPLCSFSLTIRRSLFGVMH